jgi:hypothetical protein
MLLGDKVKVRWSHELGALMMGLVALEEEKKRERLPSAIVKIWNTHKDLCIKRFASPTPCFRELVEILRDGTW